MAYKITNKDIINPDNVRKLVCPFIECDYKSVTWYSHIEVQVMSFLRLESLLLRHVFDDHILSLIKLKHNLLEENPIVPTHDKSKRVLKYYFKLPNGVFSRAYTYRLDDWEETLYKLMGKRNLKNNLIAVDLMYGK